MPLRKAFQRKVEIIKEHFDLKDLMGLSALIFGLALSNSSFRKSDSYNAVTEAPQVPYIQELNSPEGSNAAKIKKASHQRRTKKSLKSSKKQRKTAARRNKKKDGKL